MSERVIKILPWVFGVLIVINLLVLDFVWVASLKKKEISPTESPVVIPTLTFQPRETLDCSTCQKLIEEEVSKAFSSLPQAGKSTSPQISKVTPAPSSQKVNYIPIGSSGSTPSTSWTDIAGTDFYFDLGDYPGAKKVRWEVSLQSYLSSDKAYARLYDVTNKRAVDGSDLATNSSTYEYLRSSDLTIWQGNNLYRLQAKGSSGNTVNFNSPRLKIIFE